MRFALTLFLLSLLLVCGCATDRCKSGSGEVGQFILQKAIAAGANPVSTNALLSMTGHWQYFEDRYGVVIHLPATDLRCD